MGERLGSLVQRAIFVVMVLDLVRRRLLASRLSCLALIQLIYGITIVTWN